MDSVETILKSFEFSSMSRLTVGAILWSCWAAVGTDHESKQPIH